MPDNEVSIYSTWQLRSRVSKQEQRSTFVTISHLFSKYSAKYFLPMRGTYLQNWVEIQIPMQTF